MIIESQVNPVTVCMDKRACEQRRYPVTCAKCTADGSVRDGVRKVLGEWQCGDSTACALRVELREWKALAIKRRELNERDETAWEKLVEERDAELRDLRASVLAVAEQMTGNRLRGARGAVGGDQVYMWADDLCEAMTRWPSHKAPIV
jgi:hypothetical protein